MSTEQKAPVGSADGGERTPREPSAMLNVQGVSALLGCSVRHVYRMSDSGRMPRPVKLGSLVRWRRMSILAWIDAGCPSCRRR